MAKKLKITENQLKKLMEQSQEQRISFNSDLNELGGPMWKNREGKFEIGVGPDNDPEHMAELVANKIDTTINPEYYKNINLFNEFMTSLISKMKEKYERNLSNFNSPGEQSSVESDDDDQYMDRHMGVEDEEMDNKLYESIKKEFKRFV